MECGWWFKLEGWKWYMVGGLSGDQLDRPVAMGWYGHGSSIFFKFDPSNFRMVLDTKDGIR